MLAEIDHESSWQRFLVALQSDIDDIQGGTTKEGIHLGVMAGTLDLLQRAYLGTEIVDDVVYFKPTAIERLDGLRLPLQVRRTPIDVAVNGGRITVTVLAEGYTRPIIVSVDGIARELHGGDSATFELNASPKVRSPCLRTASGKRFEGAIFDVDGVLVDSPHERAWRETLQELMETRWEQHPAGVNWTPDRFTPQVYQEVIAGKPRESGALAALEHFAVPDAASRVDEYATRKQQKVIELIEAGEFGAFPDAVRLLLDAHEAGIRVAAASSSKNTGLMLGRLRLDSLADEHDMSVRLHQAAADAARPAGCGHLGPVVQARQAASGDLPDRLPGARNRAMGLLGRGGCGGRRDGREDWGHGRAWHRAQRRRPSAPGRRRRPRRHHAGRRRSVCTA